MRDCSMEPFVKKDTTYYEIQDWADKYQDLVVGFSTKHGGFSKEPFSTLNFGFHVGDRDNDVCQNRRTLANMLDFPLKQWVGAEQTHQTTIQKVTKSDSGKGSSAYSDAFKKTDGFYTSESGLLLTLCYADCVPLYFIEPNKRLIGIAHAGWRGSVAGIGAEMISRWQGEGTNPSEVLVVIGPSICENCYIVDENVITLLQNTLQDVENKPYHLIKENQYRLNLQELNKQILMNEGVLEEHILMTKLCTSCNHDVFFSHRRDNGKTGRMISFIGWKEA